LSLTRSVALFAGVRIDVEVVDLPVAVRVVRLDRETDVRVVVAGASADHVSAAPAEQRLASFSPVDRLQGSLAFGIFAEAIQ
jgi:hypothetical protein